MINIYGWFYIYRKRHFGGIVIGIAKMISIWFTKSGIEITLNEPTTSPYPFWWRKYCLEFSPLELVTYKQDLR